MYRIKMTCYDPDCAPYQDEPVSNGPFETKEEAYEVALRCAKAELKSLNGEDGGNLPADGVSFGIVQEEDKSELRVNYYYLESEFDTTGNTEPVTIYEIEEIFKNNYEMYKGFYILTYYKAVFGRKTRMFKVSQFDACLYRSSNFKKCIEFCDSFNKALRMR